MSNERKNFISILRGKTKVTAPENEEMSFIDHLEALRWHIIRCLLVVIGVGIFIFIYRDFFIDTIILGPTTDNFYSYKALCSFSQNIGLKQAFCMPPMKLDFQMNSMTAPISIAFSVAIWGGIIIGFPYIFWELWRFIKPALSAKEVQYARGSVVWVSFFFFIGVAFGYFILAPFTFNFLANFKISAGSNILYKPNLLDYFDTLSTIVIACGIAFEMPVLAMVLGKLGIITSTYLRKIKKYALVIILIAAAIITPSPDISSQLIVALPLYLLYELSILLVAREDRKRAKEFPEWS